MLEAARVELASNDIHGNKLAGIEASGGDIVLIARQNTLRANGESLAIDARALPHCTIDPGSASG